jgi:penicillin-binding protein 1C
MKRFFAILTVPAVFLFGVFLFLPKLEVPPFSPILLDQGGEVLCTQLTKDEKWRLPIQLEEVPKLYLKMLVNYEDKRFYSHPGVDLLSLARAVWQCLKNGRVISGGSTLTMQTVRLMKPRPRTILYKMEEILQALRLEWSYSKADILKIYLFLAPYGGNVEGIRAASLTYFAQNPMQLTPAKMALLVIIPQLPTLLRPHIYPQRAKVFRDKVLTRLGEKGILTPEQVREAIIDPVPAQRNGFPMHATHVMGRLRQQYPAQSVYKTTLEKKKQVALETLLQTESMAFEAHQTAAALIIENDTRHVVAYVGSAHPFSEAKNGYVDMIQAVRSPGSTLKPLIYALAFEENLIHPETLIDDVSTNFNGYSPANFREVFHGEVTIREALQQSLNIPVVHLLDRIGPGRFVDWLRQYNVFLHLPSKEGIPSLPIALGGVGIRLYDLAALYCSLANEGRFAPLTLVPSNKPLTTTPLVQPAASWYVTHILEDAPAPSGIVDWFVADKVPVAFKTGTSYGARDALCIGYTTGVKSYTAGVWTGRADGSPSPNQLGRKTAAPILLKIFNTILQSHSPQRGFSDRGPPPGVLAISGTQLPEVLRRFRMTNQTPSLKSIARSQQASGLFRIVSPQTGTIYTLQTKVTSPQSYVPIPLKIQAGSSPFFFLVNGQPTKIKILQDDSRTNHRFALWYPTKIGFFELTLIDGEGHSDTVTIRLK